MRKETRQAYQGAKSLRWFLISLALAAFTLNLIWELAQVFAFSSLEKASPLEVLILVTVASIFDAGITLLAYMIVAGVRRGWRWWQQTRVADLLIFAGVGALAATLIELVAISRGVWSYGSYMPLVPLLNIGLLPALQLTLLLPAALWVTLKVRER